MIYIILAIFLVLFIFAGYIFFKITKLKEIDSTLAICTNNISDALDKKYSVVDELLKKINSNRLSKDFNYNKDDSIHEREKSLFDIGFSINKYIKNHKDLKVEDNIHELNQIEETLDGLKDFYNANVLNYNEIFLKKYINKIYRLFKFKDYKSFKIRKLEEYEIFKI